MTHQTANPQYTKLSREFVSRLARLAPKQMIRAIVMLNTGGTERAVPRRGSSAEREAVLRATREQVESVLPDIDHVLEECGGKRLSSGADAIGGVAVQTTAFGILSLTSLEPVKAVLEDQELSFNRR